MPHSSNALIVAVTGGIASGKSAVCTLLADQGIEIIDADLIARELVEPGQPALAEIAARFGPDLLNQQGQLDRSALRLRVFADPHERLALEAILHPRIRARMKLRAESAAGHYVVLAIPLLTETTAYDWVNRIVVVDAPVALQIERLMRRDGSDLAQAEQILAAQANRIDRLRIASDVIINDQSLELLARRSVNLHLHLRSIALSDKPRLG